MSEIYIGESIMTHLIKVRQQGTKNSIVVFDSLAYARFILLENEVNKKIQ